MIVLRRGTSSGLNGLMPSGGQVEPNSIVGAKLLWKNAQKKEKKNNTSLVINKIIPYRNPNSTKNEWSPWWAPSLLTSRHHWTITIETNNNPIPRREKEYVWNHFNSPEVIKKAPVAETIGQGDSSTRW